MNDEERHSKRKVRFHHSYFLFSVSVVKKRFLK